jgi:GntR family transcriptional regulator of vanillate catabolism
VSTQTETAIVKLREMLIRGDFAAGERLGESLLAQRLQVSRTPIRLALAELAKEGLLEYKPNCGFEVRSFSIDHIINAIAVREQLEGMAAARAAEVGLSEAHANTLESCLLQIDGLLLRPELDHRDVRNWAEINGIFHSTIVTASGNEVIADMLKRLEHIPLAAARTFAGTYESLAAQQAVIRKSQVEHRWVYDAIMSKNSGRAETLMKQHVMEGRQNLRRVLERLQSEADHSKHPFLRLFA